MEEIEDVESPAREGVLGTPGQEGDSIENAQRAPDSAASQPTVSEPRVDEPENDYGGIGSIWGGRDPTGISMSSRLAREPFGRGFLGGFGFGDEDEDEDYGDDFFGGFGSMFGGLRRHMDRMQQTFSSAFNDIETMSTRSGPSVEGANAPSASSRVYCSSTCETILPNGVREVRHTSRDSATGKQTSYRSRQIGDRQIVEHSSKDLRTGVEQRQRDMLNVNEDDLNDFDRLWSSYGLGGSSFMRSLM